MLRSVLLLVTTLVLVSGSAQAQQTLKLMANTSPPYADRQLPQQGLALEIVKHVFAGTGYAPDIAIESWARALEGAEIGVYDGLATAWYTPERDRDLMFSEPYLDSRLIILKLRTQPGNYSSLQQLAGARLGVRVDYAYGIDFAAIENLQLVEENHLIQNLLNLLNGSVDFVIGDQRTVVMQLNEYLADQVTRFEVLDIELPSRARHVAINRSLADHDKIIAAFNSALAQARKDGSLDGIVSRWDERLGQLN
jgi:polar amino acid transport system substrate-binding protein